MNNCRIHNAVGWMFRLIASAILISLVTFHFTGGEESKTIFTSLGAEPWGRIATGCAELVAVVLLLSLRLTLWGALLSLALMSGIIGSHLTLGVVVQEDGGLLFSAALAVFMCAAIVLFLRRAELPLVGSFFAIKHSSCLRAVGKERGEESPIYRVDH